MYRVLEFNQPERLKSQIEFNTKKRIEAENNTDKDEVFYKLMNNYVFVKTKENLRYRIDVRLVDNKNDCLKRTLKLSYMLTKIFENELLNVKQISCW